MSFCDSSCGLDGLCNNACGNSILGLAEVVCESDPDCCSTSCELDGFCTSVCGSDALGLGDCIDPDCIDRCASCAVNGFCNLDCGSFSFNSPLSGCNPDEDCCSLFCADDGFCDTRCGGDPLLDLSHCISDPDCDDGDKFEGLIIFGVVISAITYLCFAVAVILLYVWAFSNKQTQQVQFR